MTVREAIENALEFIEAKHGHRDGAVYEGVEEALRMLECQCPMVLEQDLEN